MAREKSSSRIGMEQPGRRENKKGGLRYTLSTLRAGLHGKVGGSARKSAVTSGNFAWPEAVVFMSYRGRLGRWCEAWGLRGGMQVAGLAHRDGGVPERAFGELSIRWCVV